MRTGQTCLRKQSLHLQNVRTIEVFTSPQTKTVKKEFILIKRAVRVLKQRTRKGKLQRRQLCLSKNSKKTKKKKSKKNLT